ncbi:hypothetical protein Taro_053861 [Colocasia esculenta]|uniref:Uncharacterized protein n=1 Tax=Colocasia esculenta TaxID=4460 RepID=A0A843XNT5_COLES|nr:hypothetical protein [Colocasia esculenta]
MVPWWFWWRFSQDRLRCLYSSARCSVFSDGPCRWVVHSGEGSSQDRLCRFWRRFFLGVLGVRFGPPLCCLCGLKCAVWLGCILARFSQDDSWLFWVATRTSGPWRGVREVGSLHYGPMPSISR